MNCRHYYYIDKNNTYFWEFNSKYLDEFKRFLLKELIFNKENYLYSINNKSTIKDSDYWNNIEYLVNKINNNENILLDLEIEGCKTYTNINLKDCKLTISVYNPQGHEKDMLKFIDNFI